MFDKLPRKKRIVLTITGILLGLATACQTAIQPSLQDNNKAEVEFWTMQLQPQFTNYFNKVIANFEAANPGVKVRWVDVSWSGMESKILASVAAKNAPDVVNLNPDFAALLASKNTWLELDKVVSPAEKSTYLPNIWQANVLDGKSFGLPWYLTTVVTIYNTKNLQQAGITKPPTTYDELAIVAKQVKEKTGKYAFFVTFVPEDSGEVLQSFVQMGVPLLDKEGKAAFNTPEGKKVFEYWVKLFKDGLLPKEVLTQGHRRAIELYQSGETAILSSGPQFFKTISQNSPDIAKVSEVGPQITGKTGKKSVAVMNLVIPRDTDQPKEAVKFALFLTNDQNQLDFAKEANILPSTVAALKDSYFTSIPKDATAIDRARGISAGQMSQAEVLIPPRKDIKKLQKIIYNNLQAAMLDEKTVEQAINDAVKEWNQNLKSGT